MTSLTISFFVESILQAEELSTTRVPSLANFGAHSNDIEPPAENNAISGFILTASSRETILQFCPLKIILFPTDFSEATGIISLTGNSLSSNSLSKTVPTTPVTPTTATFISFYLFSFF